MKLFTIGFTKTSAANFFHRLGTSSVRKIIDTRLNRTSQLAGFAKEEDIRFFLGKIVNISYSVEDIFAPTSDILDAYRKKRIGWPEYARRYLDLLSDRHIEDQLDLATLDQTCLLCSEATPEHCHRRLAADYIAQATIGVEIIHL